jgi:hypothetical protein
MSRHDPKWHDARGAVAGGLYHVVDSGDDQMAVCGLAALGCVRRTPSPAREESAMKPPPRKDRGVRKAKRKSVREILRAAYRKCARDEFTRRAITRLLR